MRPRVTIIVETTVGLDTRVLLDGKEVPGVRDVIFRHEAGDVPRITLELLPETVEFEGDFPAEITMSAARTQESA
jgi:hypothetical protein